MQYHSRYSVVSEAEQLRLLEEVHMGRLVTHAADGGWPRIGLFPFTHGPGWFELHLPRGDEQVEDLRADPRCLFEVDDILSVIPAGWQGRHDARDGDALYRGLVHDAEARLSDDPAAIAAQIRGLLERHEPDGDHTPLDPGSPLYRPSLARLVLVRLEVQRKRATFKCAQQVTPDERLRILAGLRRRGTDVDRRSADLIHRIGRAVSGGRGE